MHVSERRACAALGQHRSTQRKVPRGRDDEELLTADIVALARQYGRYGYRKIAGLLEQTGWIVNDKRVERIWRREGLKVPHKQPKRGRLWLADGSCIRLRPEHRNHVWSYDFVEDRTHDGRKYRMLNVIDEFTHECLAIRVARKLKAIDVNQAAPGRMVTSRASTHACEMNCSMVKYSTRCVRPKSSSKVGGATSTQSGRMNRWTTSRQHRKCSCPPSLRGRLRYVDRLRRPRWRNGQLSTNIPPGPLDGGRSVDQYPDGSLARVKTPQWLPPHKPTPAAPTLWVRPIPCVTRSIGNLCPGIRHSRSGTHCLALHL